MADGYGQLFLLAMERLDKCFCYFLFFLLFSGAPAAQQQIILELAVEKLEKYEI